MNAPDYSYYSQVFQPIPQIII
uniref:Uncharacterized protein n=1 Tax=Lepeophtheirus salmonis TaxID=72036 RepID=A0A0K2U1K0_LEPSM